MCECQLHWEDSDAGAEPIATVELIAPPRKGDEIWFELLDDDGNHVRNHIVKIKGVLHVADHDDGYPYIELTVRDTEEVKVEASIGREHCGGNEPVMG